MDRRKYIKTTMGTALLASTMPAHSLFGKSFPGMDKSQHICIFSKHLQWLDYEDMAKLARDIGFAGIDLSVRKGGHVLPENVKRDLPRAVQHIRDAGLEVPMITTGITDSEDPDSRSVLETAGKLGIKLYRTGWFRYKKGSPVSEILENSRKRLAGLEALNKDYNIAASYQNHAGSYVGSSGWDLLHILGDLDPQWVGVQYDIRHAMVEGPDSWPYILELLAPYINSLDIKDFAWDTTQGLKVMNVPLGQGLVQFEEYIKKLDELNIKADFSIHYEYPLGGAEHGDRDITISKEEFVKKTASDLAYFKKKLTD
jgi:sugar phosphate isomerase/epimerase